MSGYYSGGRARRYNRRWRTYTQKTLAAALAMIDFAALQRVPEEEGRPPRALDVACGTGLLLGQLLEHVPGLEAYGVDASADMLAQAREVLKGRPGVRLERVEIGGAGLPYPPRTFDLITCTNALHDLRDPLAFLQDARERLSPGGQLVLEDFARRRPAVLWAALEWLARRVGEGYVRALTPAEARALCTRAGLHVTWGQAFRVDWFWHGWALRAHRLDSA